MISEKYPLGVNYALQERKDEIYKSLIATFSNYELEDLNKLVVWENEILGVLDKNKEPLFKLYDLNNIKSTLKIGTVTHCSTTCINSSPLVTIMNDFVYSKTLLSIPVNKKLKICDKIPEMQIPTIGYLNQIITKSHNTLTTMHSLLRETGSIFSVIDQLNELRQTFFNMEYLSIYYNYHAKIYRALYEQVSKDSSLDRQLKTHIMKALKTVCIITNTFSKDLHGILVKEFYPKYNKTIVSVANTYIIPDITTKYYDFFDDTDYLKSSDKNHLALHLDFSKQKAEERYQVWIETNEAPLVVKRLKTLKDIVKINNNGSLNCTCIFNILGKVLDSQGIFKDKIPKIIKNFNNIDPSSKIPVVSDEYNYVYDIIILEEAMSKIKELKLLTEMMPSNARDFESILKYHNFEMFIDSEENTIVYPIRGLRMRWFTDRFIEVKVTDSELV